MFKSSTDHTIISLVNQVLGDNHHSGQESLGNNITRHNGGMLIELAMVVTNPTLDYSLQYKTKQQQWYYVAFCGNTSVFVARQDTHDSNHLRHYTAIPTTEWKNTSNHISCWRSDGMRWMNEAYFEMCEACNPDIIPAELDSICQIGFIKLWHNVQMDIKLNSDEIFYSLVNIKEVKD